MEIAVNPKFVNVFCGYQKTDDGIGIKNECDASTIGSNECPNGTCISNGMCLCDEGFVKNNSSLEWEPIPCENCTGRYCAEPYVCQCNIGYYLNIGVYAILDMRKIRLYPALQFVRQVTTMLMEIIVLIGRLPQS